MSCPIFMVGYAGLAMASPYINANLTFKMGISTRFNGFW